VTLAVPLQQVLASAAAALLFSATFVAGGRIHPRLGLVRDRRTLVSFGAGVAIAYVFVHMMPELHDARRAFAASDLQALRYEGMAIYYCALLGFLVFYGMDHLRKRMHLPARERSDGANFRIQIGGYAAYVWLMAYLLVNNLEGSTTSVGLFAFAIAIHFLGIDHSLREEHGADYERTGRFLLAGMSLLGWGVGMLVELPRPMLALLLAFVSGAVIMNSSIMELPTESGGRFLPFLAGSLIYGLILLPLG
jgi:hypothetical protein